MKERSTSAVDPEERISRYLLQKRYIKLEKGEIKAEAFLPTTPKPEFPERQTSVYRTGDCEETEIWSIGDHYVANPGNNRFVLARGDLFAQTVYSQDLPIVPHPSPHPRHANIVWPNEESNEHRKAKAVLLAQASKLIVRPST